MNLDLTLVVQEGSNGYLIGQIKEIPAVLTQGKTIEEVRENIIDALELYLEDMREDKARNGNVIFEGKLEVA